MPSRRRRRSFSCTGAPAVPGARPGTRRSGRLYPKSDLGRLLPLRTVDLDRDPAPAVALLRPVLFTPTFVVADEGREIGRIEGYPGQDFFWGLLEKLARGLPPHS